MAASQRVLLINPTITSHRHARFPLALMSLSAALEGKYQSTIIDGNVDRDYIATAVRALETARCRPWALPSWEGRSCARPSQSRRPSARNSPRADSLGRRISDCLSGCCAECGVRRLCGARAGRGNTRASFCRRSRAAAMRRWKRSPGCLGGRRGEIVHNKDRKFSAASLNKMLPYEKLENPRQYLTDTYLGRRTIGYQAALGCRFRCTFCGVAKMFNGKMALPPAARLEQDLQFMQDRFGVDAIQFYDHNFFDREVDMVPLLEVLAKFRMPWWCFARSDALVNLSERSWALVKKSRLRMAYIGAESPSDWLLHDIRKGTSRDQTLEAVEKCRSHGVIPELSFMLAPPQDPEGETEKTFEFIRLIKRLHPATEVMIYIYTPLPRRHDDRNPASLRAESALRDCNGKPVVFPQTADGWAEPQWVDYWCHQSAPWLSERLRRRIVDFTTVLGCRYPTIMDIRASAWGKSALRALGCVALPISTLR